MEAVSRILPVTTLAAVAPDLSSVLTPGQAVQARVQQILADGLYRLITPRGPIDVASPSPLLLGTTVSVSLTKVAGETTLRIIVPSAAQQQPTAAAPATTRPAGEPPAASLSLGSASPAPASTTIAVLATTVAAQSGLAARPAAAPGSATAPLMAAPPAALGQTPFETSAPISIAPHGAAEPAAAPVQSTRAAPAAVAAPAPQSPLFAAIASALTRQDGLAPLVANLAALAARPRSEVPQAVRTASDRLAALRLDVTQGVTAEALEAALERSGVFFEARLGRGDAPGPRGDFKAMLLALREDLTALIRPEAPETNAPQPRPDRPAPPMRGEPPAAQKAAVPVQLPNAPSEVARVLLQETEAGLARMRLAQVASLPVEAGEGARMEQAPAALHATIPLGLGRETALLELVVERDASQRASSVAPAPLWRVWLALDVEPAGPVTALVTLGGAERSVGITFWAEREATERALAAALPGLRTALTAADLAVGETVARSGRPRRVTRSGRFLDTTT